MWLYFDGFYVIYEEREFIKKKLKRERLTLALGS